MSTFKSKLLAFAISQNIVLIVFVYYFGLLGVFLFGLLLVPLLLLQNFIYNVIDRDQALNDLADRLKTRSGEPEVLSKEEYAKKYKK